MSQPDTDDPGRAPTHHVALFVAALVTTATLAVHLMYATAGHPAIEQPMTMARVACMVVWCWYFAASVVYAVGRRFDVIEGRLTALEGAEREGRASGLDSESIGSARAIGDGGFAEEFLKERRAARDT